MSNKQEIEPGEKILDIACPCCGAELEIMYGDDPGEIAVLGTRQAETVCNYTENRTLSEEVLRKLYYECAHCGAALMHPTYPPHCEGCEVTDDEFFEWQDAVNKPTRDVRSVLHDLKDKMNLVLEHGGYCENDVDRIPILREDIVDWTREIDNILEE
jgi:hypothetical protein